MNNFFDQQEDEKEVVILPRSEMGKCSSCGLYFHPDQLEFKLCPFTNERLKYCDDVCFHWRYYDPKHNPTRYDFKGPSW